LDIAKGTTLTLAPGAYGQVMVRANAVLTLTGGTYHLENLNLGDNNSKIYFQGATDLVIRNRLEPGRNSIIGPAEGSGLQAHDIRIYVNGINGSTGNLGGSPKAAIVGESSTVKANLYAPSGTLWIRFGSEAEGAPICVGEIGCRLIYPTSVWAVKELFSIGALWECHLRRGQHASAGGGE
jgi:hypothetical protein